jgi:hypothetical protein
MRINILVWWFMLTTFMIALKHLLDYIDDNTSLLLFVSFGPIYIFIYGMYKMMKIIDNDTSIYNIVFTLFLLFMGGVGCKIIIPTYLNSNSTNKIVYLIIFMIIGFIGSIQKVYKLLSNRNQSDEQLQPLL